MGSPTDSKPTRPAWAATVTAVSSSVSTSTKFINNRLSNVTVNKQSTVLSRAARKGRRQRNSAILRPFTEIKSRSMSARVGRDALLGYYKQRLVAEGEDILEYYSKFESNLNTLRDSSITSIS